MCVINGSNISQRFGNMKSFFGRFVAAVVVGLGVCAGVSAEAATFTWRTGAGTALWGTATNWVGGTVPTPGLSTFLEYKTNTAASVTTNNNLSNPFELFQLFINGNTRYTFTGSPMQFGTGGSIVNTATVVQTFNSTINAGGPTMTIETSKLLNLNGGVAGSSVITVKGGGTVALDGNANDALFIVDGNTTLNIKNNRTISELIVSSGILQLSGDDSGVANVSNGVTFTAGSTVNMDVAGLTPGSSGFDQLISDTVSFRGAMSLDMTGLGDLGGVGDRGTSFKLFDSNSYSGNFTSITASGGLYTGLNPWTPGNNGSLASQTFGSNGNYFYFDQTNGTLAVVPEPSTIVFAALGVTISGVHCINKRRRNKSAIAA